MPYNTPTTSPIATPAWSFRDDASILETYSKRPSSASVLSDSVINLGVPRKSTNLADDCGSSTPGTWHRIENASPDTARFAALRMYETLKKHGLRDEAVKAFTKEEKVNEEHDAGDQVDDKESKELIGMEYLMKKGSADYLRKMAKVLPPIPRQIVRFSGIKYSKKLQMVGTDYETFGSKLVGSIFGPLRKFTRKTDPVQLDLLKGIDGYVMPGSMTLVLGPPGCGKSTLLEILANKIEESKSTFLQGEVMYNNKHVSEVRHSRMIAYISGQINRHIPFLSVRETLEFARDCSQGLRPENLSPQMRKFFAHALVEGQDPFLEHILEILSLKRVENQLAGNSISDTDHQKLTTAELAVGTYSVLIYDQPLSGCDLAATYDLVDTVRTISRIQQSSAVMSLTQLSDEVYDLFDRIIVLSHGQVVFQGPRQDAIHYFSNIGYKKPSHVESVEFLEDIAAGYGYQYTASGVMPLSTEELVENYRSSNHYIDIMRIIKQDSVKHTYWAEGVYNLGLSLKTLEYQNSGEADPVKRKVLIVTKISQEIGEYGGIKNTSKVQIGDLVTAVSLNNEETTYLSAGNQTNQYDLPSRVYFKLKKIKGHARVQIERSEEQVHEIQFQNFKRPYVQTWWRSTGTLIRRQSKITKRLHVILKLRIFQAVVLGIFSGTLFYKLGGKYDQQKMNSVRALGFVSTMSIMLINLVQLPLYMLQRPVFYKHQAQRFFRASSYVAACGIVNLPQTIIEALLYNLCMYFFAGLSLTGHGAAFWEVLLLLFLVAYFGSSVFLFLSAVSSVLEAGNAMAGLLVSIFLLFSGFVIYPSNIPQYFKWLMYANPIHWANISFCRIQFETYVDPCSNYVNGLPFCNQFPDMTVGQAYLHFYQLHRDSMRPWHPYVVIFGWIVLANILAMLGLKKLEFVGTRQSLPYVRRTHRRSNHLADIENEFLSESSYDKHPSHSGNFKDSQFFNLNLGTRNVMDDGGVHEWIDEFHIDIEKNDLQIQIEPTALVFEDLSFSRYDVYAKQNTTVFKDVTGYAKPHSMLAIFGGSQASKSTLLKCLAGRIQPAANLKGTVRLSAAKSSISPFRLIGYVERFDAHHPYLSVLESLQFSAALRLSNDIHTRRRQIYVETVLNELGLLPYSNQLVGSLRDSTGRTFEIAKKLTIGVELAANASILFLEEPISGLDAIGTLNILNALTRQSESGRTIIASLTHPNMRSLSFFNQALILTREGQQAFFGPLGANCSTLIDYFSAIPTTPSYNFRDGPIRYVMGILGQGVRDKKAPSLNFSEIYMSSSTHKNVVDSINLLKQCNTESELNYRSPSYTASHSRQVDLVMLRTQKFLWRNVQYTYGRLTGCVIMGFLMGSLYFDTEYKDTYGVTSRSLYIYMQVMLIGVISANNVIPQIGTDRLIYFREKRARMYHPIFYPLSWAIGEIPYFLIATLALAGIGNSMAGIAVGSATEFCKYWMVLFLFTLSVTYFGMMVTFLAPSPAFAAFIVSIVTSLWVSASGVIVILSDIKFYRWMYWSNPFQYAISALTSISFYCDTKGCSSDCKCPHLPDGSYVWDRLAGIRSLSHSRIDIDIVSLIGMSALFASLSFLFFVSLKQK